MRYNLYKIFILSVIIFLCFMACGSQIEYLQKTSNEKLPIGNLVFGTYDGVYHIKEMNIANLIVSELGNLNLDKHLYIDYSEYQLFLKDESQEDIDSFEILESSLSKDYVYINLDDNIDIYRDSIYILSDWKGLVTLHDQNKTQADTLFYDEEIHIFHGLISPKHNKYAIISSKGNDRESELIILDLKNKKLLQRMELGRSLYGGADLNVMNKTIILTENVFTKKGIEKSSLKIFDYSNNTFMDLLATQDGYYFNPKYLNKDWIVYGWSSGGKFKIKTEIRLRNIKRGKEYKLIDAKGSLDSPINYFDVTTN